MTQPTSVDKAAQEGLLVATAVTNAPLAAWLIVVIGLVVALLSATASARRAGLRADSLEATRDTVHRDSTAVLLRAIQTTIAADVREALTHRTPVVVVRDTVVLPPIHDTVRAAVLTDQDERSGHFAVHDTSYDALADVTLPATGLGTLALDVRLRPIMLDTRIECGMPRDGIAPAQVRIVAPPPYRIGLSQPVVAPNVCSPAITLVGKPTRWLLAGVGVVGLLLGHLLR